MGSCDLSCIRETAFQAHYLYHGSMFHLATLFAMESFSLEKSHRIKCPHSKSQDLHLTMQREPLSGLQDCLYELLRDILLKIQPILEIKAKKQQKIKTWSNIL